MSSRHRPKKIPPAPPGYFQITEWKSEKGSPVIRDRWRHSLNVQGIKTKVVTTEGLSALYREGIEALSTRAIFKRKRAAKDKLKKTA
jgi:hypothetical protein